MGSRERLSETATVIINAQVGSTTNQIEDGRRSHLWCHSSTGLERSYRHQRLITHQLSRNVSCSVGLNCNVPLKLLLADTTNFSFLIIIIIKTIIILISSARNTIETVWWARSSVGRKPRALLPYIWPYDLEALLYRLYTY